MISRASVAKSIDLANEHLEHVWSVLKQGKGQLSADGDRLIKCQVRLIEALWILDTQYISISREKKRIIENKRRYVPTWFAITLNRLDQYLKAIKSEIGKAKVIGDGYAWIFYHKDTRLIDEHLKCQRQTNLPPGVGGIGERAFVEKLQGLDGKFVLYHGITSFLRMGDVSFYDPKSRRISSIGELKSEKIGLSEYRITLGLVYGEGFEPTMRVHTHGDATKQPTVLPKLMEARFNRQMREIGRALKSSKISDAELVRRRTGQCYFEELEAVLGECKEGKAAYKKAGKGLLLAAVRLGQNSASQIALGDTVKLNQSLDSLPESAQSICDPKLRDNCIFVGSVGYSEDGFPLVLEGTVPLFWWPICRDKLRDLIFGEVVVVSIYNPAHFWETLRSNGYVVSINERSRFSSAIKEVKDKKKVRLENLDYFRWLAEHFLVSDDSLIGMLNEATLLAEDKGRDGPLKLRLKPRLVF